MKELYPVNQHVLLEVDEEKEQKTASGLIIPDSVKQRQKFAKVTALSNIENPEISVGDIVFFKEFSATELTVDGKLYLLVPYADILSRVVETDSI